MADRDLLRLVHWLSPVFPVGSYAYSAGLETAIADEIVTSEDTLYGWLETSLVCGSARTDAILLTSAMAGGSDLDALSDWARAFASSSERWQETFEQGQAFVRALGDMGLGDGVARPLPVAIGQAARGLDVSPSQVAGLYLQSLVANLATGAVRHIPLGQSAGSRVIAGLSDRIMATASEAEGLGPEDAYSSAFGADMIQMRHETQETRIFRT